MATHDTTTDADTQNGQDAQDALNSLNDALERLRISLNQVEDADLDELDDHQLADAYAALRDGETRTEEVRKDTVGEELEERIDTGERLEGDFASVTLVEGHRKYIGDEEAAINALEDAGVDPQEAMEVNATDLANLAEEHGVDAAAEQIKRATYTYARTDRN